jgi:hypothetical protein
MTHDDVCSHRAIGRSIYFSQAQNDKLGGGVELWRGIFQSLRPTQVLPSLVKR